MLSKQGTLAKYKYIPLSILEVAVELCKYGEHFATFSFLSAIQNICCI